MYLKEKITVEIPNKNITRKQFHSLTNGPTTRTRKQYCNLFDILYGGSRLHARIIIEKDVVNERLYQMAKWGDEILPPSELLAILGEEVGEACKAYLERDAEEYRAELVQVAAVALRGIQMIDRRDDLIEPIFNRSVWRSTDDANEASTSPLALEETLAPDAIEPQALLQ